MKIELSNNAAGIGYGLITASGLVGALALIVFGVNSCSERQDRLKAACIGQGGSVIEYGDKFACVVGGRSTTQP